MLRIRITCLIAFLSLATIVAGRPIFSMFKPTQPVPDGAAIILRLDKAEFFLGEDVVLHFVVQNQSNKPFTIQIGGDNTFPSGHSRYQVTGADVSGKALIDPNPHLNGGGDGGPRDITIEPGKEWSDALKLQQYCIFDVPGEYTIRAWHDLGWSEDATHQRPVGETKVKFIRPTAEQAEKLVDEWSTLPAGVTLREAIDQRLLHDFHSIRDPVYLPALSKKAEANSPGAIDGIQSIKPPAATTELLRLLTFREKPNAEAAEALLGRMPSVNDPQNVRGWPTTLWDSKDNPVARQAARKMLVGNEESIDAGGRLLEAIGEKEDLPDLLAALTRAMKISVALQGNDAAELEPPGSAVEAMNAIVKRGAAVNPQPATPAELALYLMTLANDKTFRPAGWQDRCTTAMGDPQFYLRVLAMRASSGPLTDPARAAVLPLFASKNHKVKQSACDLAARLHDTELKAGVLNVVRTARDYFEIESANAAAVALGAKVEACEIWVERLGEPQMVNPAMHFLSSIVKPNHYGTGGNGNIGPEEIASLQKRWREFLPAHREQIQAGQLFEIGDPILTPDLFGKAFQFDTKDGKGWPPRSK